MPLSALISLLGISAAITAGLGYYAWKHRLMPGASAFAALMAITVIWIAANALEMAGNTLEGKLFWANLQYFSYSTIPICYLILVVHFTGRESFLKPRNLLLLSIIPAITNFLIWTNPFHELARRNVFLDTSGPFPVIGKTYGPWTYVHFSYSYLLFLISIALLVKTILSTKPTYRGQLYVLLFGLLLPLFTNVLYIMGLSPIQRHDISPAVMGLSGVFVTLGLFRYRLFDILPVVNDAILMSIGDGIVVLDVHRRVTAINPSAKKILNWSSREVGNNASHLLSSWPQLEEIIQNNTRAHLEVEFDIDGALRYFDFNLTPLLGQFRRPVGYLMIFHDITDSKQVEEDLRVLSNTDPLTFLSNRRKFLVDLRGEIERSRRYDSPLSLMMIDVNKMKQINDTLGHMSGDEALRRVADVLGRLRQADQAARYGGDEFVVLLPSTALTEAEHTAMRLQDAIQQELLGDGLRLSISVGIAELNSADDILGESLLERADAAMYGAKAAKQSRGEVEELL